MTQWDKAKRIVVDRDSMLCVRCKKEATDVHHRLPRKMGGTRNEKIAYGLANLISLCRDCHNWVHANPFAAHQLGYLLKTGEDPEVIPIQLGYGMELKICSDGTTEQTGLCDLFLQNTFAYRTAAPERQRT